MALVAAVESASSGAPTAIGSVDLLVWMVFVGVYGVRMVIGRSDTASTNTPHE